MGNSFPVKCQNTGTNGIILFTSRNQRYDDDEKGKGYYVTYHLDGKYVHLNLEITYGKDGHCRLLEFQFEELRSMFYQELRSSMFYLRIDKSENNLFNLNQIYDFMAYYETHFFNETMNHWGGVTKTNVAYRGSENEGNLLVVEQKRKKGVEKPFAITVTHYYAFSKQSFIRQKKYEVGVSVVVDIKVLNNNIDVSWKGYYEHPSRALFQMFEQVTRTWIWKWTLCPHCAAQTHIRQFDTETENDDEERHYLQCPRQIGGNILANQGVINGNNNGNILVNKLIVRGG